MLKVLAFLCALFLPFFVGESADAKVLTFNDITIKGDTNVQTYGGWDWTNVSIIHKDTQIFDIINHGYKNGAVSGNYIAMNNYTQAAKVVDNSKQLAMDNDTFKNSDPVPEAASVLLFGTSLVSLAAFRKKFNKT